jgi:hypothetical protein
MKLLTFALAFFSLSLLANECTDLNKCVEYISKLTGKKYLYEAKINGNLQFSSNFQITAENADNMFSYILSANGFARVPTSEKDTYKLVEARDIRYQTLPTINVDSATLPQVPSNEDYYVMTYLFKNHLHGQLRASANQLRPFMSRYGRIVETPQSVAVMEMASKLKTFYETIKANDRILTKEELKKFEEDELESKEERKAERKSEKKDAKKSKE